jgi:hypothetical protein
VRSENSWTGILYAVSFPLGCISVHQKCHL